MARSQARRSVPRMSGFSKVRDAPMATKRSASPGRAKVPTTISGTGSVTSSSASASRNSSASFTSASRMMTSGASERARSMATWTSSLRSHSKEARLLPVSSPSASTSDCPPTTSEV